MCLFALHWQRHRFYSGPFAGLTEGAESSNLVMLLGGPISSRREIYMVGKKLLSGVQYLRSFLLLRMVKDETRCHYSA